MTLNIPHQTIHHITKTYQRHHMNQITRSSWRLVDINKCCRIVIGQMKNIFNKLPASHNIVPHFTVFFSSSSTIQFSHYTKILYFTLVIDVHIYGRYITLSTFIMSRKLVAVIKSMLAECHFLVMYFWVILSRVTAGNWLVL